MQQYKDDLLAKAALENGKGNVKQAISLLIEVMSLQKVKASSPPPCEPCKPDETDLTKFGLSPEALSETPPAAAKPKTRKVVNP